MMNFNLTIATAALIAAGICIAGATGAAAQTVSPTAKVSYAGLDLSSPAGEVAMQHRIKQVAVQLCGDAKIERLHTVREESAKCIRETIANANAELARVAPVTIASR